MPLPNIVVGSNDSLVLCFVVFIITARFDLKVDLLAVSQNRKPLKVLDSAEYLTIQSGSVQLFLVLNNNAFQINFFDIELQVFQLILLKQSKKNLEK